LFYKELQNKIHKNTQNKKKHYSKLFKIEQVIYREYKKWQTFYLLSMTFQENWKQHCTRFIFCRIFPVFSSSFYSLL